ncbi:hypothetical protein [Cryptosporangium minutisporangium]
MIYLSGFAAAGVAIGALALGGSVRQWAAYGVPLLILAGFGLMTAWSLGRRRRWAYWVVVVEVIGHAIGALVSFVRDPDIVPAAVCLFFALLAWHLLRPTIYQVAVGQGTKG